MHFCIVSVLLHQRCRKSKVKHQQAVFILAAIERNQTSPLLPSPIRTRELCALPPPSVIWQVNVPSFSSVKWSIMNSMIPVETSWPILLGCRETGLFFVKTRGHNALEARLGGKWILFHRNYGSNWGCTAGIGISEYTSLCTHPLPCNVFIRNRTMIPLSSDPYTCMQLNRFTFTAQ